jgi:hypothetical protein
MMSILLVKMSMMHSAQRNPIVPTSNPILIITVLAALLDSIVRRGTSSRKTHEACYPQCNEAHGRKPRIVRASEWSFTTSAVNRIEPVLT